MDCKNIYCCKYNESESSNCNAFYKHDSIVQCESRIRYENKFGCDGSGQIETDVSWRLSKTTKQHILRIIDQWYTVKDRQPNWPDERIVTFKVCADQLSEWLDIPKAN